MRREAVVKASSNSITVGVDDFAQSYIYVCGDGACPVARTVEVEGSSLQVDLDADGRILGIENYAGLVDASELMQVLGAVRWSR